MAGDTWANTSLLQEYRRRALAVFPELETCGHEFFGFMSLYAREIPWKFFDRGTATNALRVLNEIRATDDRLLLSFFTDRHGEIEIAFRSLDEINRAFFHDRDWWSLADLEQIRDIRELIHPAYLQLCEAVLKTLLHPIAVFQRRKGDSKSETFKADERIDAAKKAGLGAFEPFDSVVRNAIAHGRVKFAKDSIHYRNIGTPGEEAPRKTPSETLRLFEDLLDICNGLAVAYRLLVLLDQKLLFSESAPVPPALVFPEVQHQLNTVRWHVRDYLEYEYGNGQRDLNLFVESSYFDDHKTQLSVIRAATFASSFMPSFDRCHVWLDRRGIGGWGIFDTAKVRELLLRGITDGPSHLTAAPDGGFFIPPWSRYFRVFGPFRLIGSVTEVLRTSWPALCGKVQRPEVRHVRTVSKRTYACVTATAVLHIDDLQTAMNFVANNIRSLLRGAVKEGWRQPETSKWLRWLPAGYVQVDVLRSDRRRRQLLSSGIDDANLLCRIVRKTRGQIPITPLHGSVPQDFGDVNVFWNRAAIEPLVKTAQAGS